MSELERSLDRLSGAVSALLDASERGRAERKSSEKRIAELTKERDRLRAELEELRAARQEDAHLRAEAAEAVKDALRDLRALLAEREEEDRKKTAQGGRNA